MPETSPKPKSTLAGAYASILLSASLWGIMGLWNRNLMRFGFTPTNIVAIRNFCGMVLLVAVFAVKDRSVFRIRRAHLKYFLGTGIFSVVLFTACYFSCQQICSLAVASVLLYTAPAFVVVMTAVLWKEPLTKKKALALLLTLVGCALTCGLFAGDLRVTVPGVLLGLGAGFFYAMYSVLGRTALAHYGSMTVTVWTFLVAEALAAAGPAGTGGVLHCPAVHSVHQRPQPGGAGQGLHHGQRGGGGGVPGRRGGLWGAHDPPDPGGHCLRAGGRVHSEVNLWQSTKKKKPT